MTIISPNYSYLTNKLSFKSEYKNNPIADVAAPASDYQYTSPIHSYGLNYFISNISKDIKNTPKNESSPIKADGSVQLKIGYINDVHGQYIKLEKMGNALSDCDIKFSGGDNMIGTDKNAQINRGICKYLEHENIEASALGNHDLDMSEKAFKEITDNLKTKYMAVNFSQDEKTKTIHPDEYIQERLTNSYIGEYKGVKYGVVGAAPCDLFERMNLPEIYSDCNVQDLDATINSIQAEVDKLKEQGINKIFLLSHVGHHADRKIAQETSGIDVIIGGHSHHYVNGITPNENWFLSKSNEPVLITSAEKDGNYYGKADLVFDKNGILTNASNNLYETSSRHKNLIYKKIFDSYAGEPEKVGIIKSALPAPKNRLTEENPHANFVADAIRNELNVDIGIVNGGNIRNSFEEGTFDTSDAKSISPFGDDMVIAKASEKDIVDLIKLTAKSITDINGKPGLMYASGLNYTLKRGTGELLSMTYTDKNGNKTEIDVNNPNPNKMYRVAADDFIMKGREGMDMMNHYDEAEQVFDFSEDKLIADYIKTLTKANKPIEINQTGRINIVD